MRTECETTAVGCNAVSGSDFLGNFRSRNLQLRPFIRRADPEYFSNFLNQAREHGIEGCGHIPFSIDSNSAHRNNGFRAGRAGRSRLEHDACVLSKAHRDSEPKWQFVSQSLQSRGWSLDKRSGFNSLTTTIRYTSSTTRMFAPD